VCNVTEPEAEQSVHAHMLCHSSQAAACARRISGGGGASKYECM
jgi:hypothetical protein